MSMYTCSANKEHRPVGLMPKFCSECGAEVTTLRCSKCKTTLLPSQNFCEVCGTRTEKGREDQQEVTNG